MNARDEARAALARFEDVDRPGRNVDVAPLVAALRALLGEPVPADEREALYELWSRHGSSYESDSSEGYELADAILAAGFRRQGPITDTQVEAAAQAIHDQECSCNNAGFHGRETISFRKESARRALEAARDAS